MEFRAGSKKRRAILAAAALLSAGAATPPSRPLPILPLSEIRAGMKGYGLTVASGDKAERFGVEVIGVVPNATPGRTSVVVRLSGLGLEESGIVAGMSGSPVYLEGKLAGAVATGWGFTKGPIGGMTPIEAMLAVASDGAGETGAARATSAGTGLRAGDLLRALAQPEAARVAALDGLAARLRLDAPAGGTPLLSPLASGFPAETLDRHRAALPALLPMGLPLPAAAAAGSAPPAPGPPPAMEGGSAITALLVEGDLQLGATGTVTAVLPDGRFVAFGHPFLGLGELALPVAPAHVVSFLPNVYQSFKIAYAGKPAWRLIRDRDSAVTGALDRTAPMVPVTLRFASAGVDRTFSFRIAPHARLLPILVGLTTDAALTIADPTPRDRTVRFRLAYDTVAGTVAYEDVASGMRAKDLAVLTASVLGGVLEENELGDPEISRIALDFRSEPGEKRYHVLSAALASAKVHPGETLVATVRLADRRGGETTRTFRIPVPKQMPEGHATLVVADGGTATGLRLLTDPVEPRTLADLKRILESLVPTDRLTAAILVSAHASATGPATLSALPPTAAALLAEPFDAPDSLRANVSARILSEASIAFDRPVSGSARLDFDVERPRF